MRTIPDDQLGRSLVLTGITTLVYWWYCARLESSHWQGTLGQQLMGMRVTDLHGRRISFMRATGRFFAQWLSFVLCCTGYLFNLWSTRRQTLHDMIAGCVFVVGGTAPASVPSPAPAPLVEQAP